MAVMALGAPSRARRRRYSAPRALLLWWSVWAARRRASAARFLIRFVRRERMRPPVFLLLGHRPSQEARFLSLGKRVMSTPHSLMTVWAVKASIPSMRVR